MTRLTEITCTFPLHVEERSVSHARLVHVQGAQWCQACQRIAVDRARHAKDPGYRTRRKRASWVTTRYGTRRRMVQFANRHALPGERWCGWGMHYAAIVHFSPRTRGSKEYQSYCKDCLHWSNQAIHVRRKQREQQALRELERHIKEAQHELLVLRRVITDVQEEIASEKEAHERFMTSYRYNGFMAHPQEPFNH